MARALALGGVALLTGALSSMADVGVAPMALIYGSGIVTGALIFSVKEADDGR